MSSRFHPYRFTTRIVRSASESTVNVTVNPKSFIAWIAPRKSPSSISRTAAPILPSVGDPTSMDTSAMSDSSTSAPGASLTYAASSLPSSVDSQTALKWMQEVKSVKERNDRLHTNLRQSRLANRVLRSQLDAQSHMMKALDCKNQELKTQCQSLYAQSLALQEQCTTMSQSSQDEANARAGDKHLHCSICYTNSMDTALTPCGHVFCFSCLEQWRATRSRKSKKIVCPHCRSRGRSLRLFTAE